MSEYTHECENAACIPIPVLRTRFVFVFHRAEISAEELIEGCLLLGDLILVEVLFEEPFKAHE